MDVKLPPLGEGADSGTVVSILVKEGDQISKGQTILELETGKAVSPVSASAAGKISRIHVKEGAKISVGALLLSLDGGGAVAPVAPAQKSAPAASALRPTASVQPAIVAETGAIESLDQDAGYDRNFPAPASPSVRAVALELGIDLYTIRGSANGRIVMADLKSYLQHLRSLAARGTTSGAAPATRPAKASAPSVDFSRFGPIAKRPMTSLRKVISRRMTENWNAIPHVTQFDEIDLSRVMELRKKYVAAYETKSAKLTVTSFALKAVVQALKKHPIFNTSLDEIAEEVVFKEYIHLGIAVDSDQGLLVPVIKDADKKDMVTLSKELSALAEKARDRKLGLEDMQGGTFTISNQGSFGGSYFTPIVNKPEVAILGMGKGAFKPVVTADKKIEPRLLLPVGLSYDHRIIDGGAAARFMMDLVEAFQNFDEALVKI